MSPPLVGFCIHRLVALALITSVPVISWAQNRFDIPGEAKYKFIGQCIYMENREPVHRPCAIYTLPREPEEEYMAYLDTDGNVIEVTKHSNSTGREQKIWPK